MCYIFLLVITKPYIGMSVGTSDSIVISSTKTEAHNPDPAITSAEANVHGSSSANFPGNIAENSQ